MSKPLIVFFGTGPVAAKSLELLIENFEIEAVVTKPKPAGHRGDYPVLNIASKNNLPIVEVTNKTSVSECVTTRCFSSKLAILIDFGIIVDKDVIDAFDLGIINSHFSLLPKWRGADPITFSILYGEEKSGVSLMVIDEGMDTGKIIAQKSLRIDTTETSPSLTNKLIDLSNEMLREHVPNYFAGTLKPRSQPHPERATYSRKLNKQDGLIDWTKSAEEIEREIRAFVEWPKSKTSIGSVDVIIAKAHVLTHYQGGDKPGDLTVQDDTGELIMKCGKNSLSIDVIKPAGKNVMSAADFIRGYKSKLRA